MPSNKLSIIYVEWLDASYQRGECTLDELTPAVILKSAGILVREDDDTVSIALDRYDADEVYRYIEHIPRVNIRKMKRFKV